MAFFSMNKLLDTEGIQVINNNNNKGSVGDGAHRELYTHLITNSGISPHAMKHSGYFRTPAWNEAIGTVVKEPTAERVELSPTIM